jgi:hypothetical protein
MRMRSVETGAGYTPEMAPTRTLASAAKSTRIRAYPEVCMDGKRELLRHVVATIAYRGGKALRGAPAGFGQFRAAAGSRSAVEILDHLGDLFDWGTELAAREGAWREVKSADWEVAEARFFSGLARLDAVLSVPDELRCSEEKLFQGPLADSLTHIGQIAMLRRLAAAPVRGENYARADIAAGRVGAEQSAPRREFD